MKDFGEALTRVIKKVNRTSKDGTSKKVDQAYHVKKAAPGDRYAAAPRPKQTQFKGVQALHRDQVATSNEVDFDGPDSPHRSVDFDGPEGGQGRPQNQQGGDPTVAQAQPEIPMRVSVRYYEPPWVKKKLKDEDPIPRDVRLRFDKRNLRTTFSNPMVPGMPVIGVIPTDRIFWGADEPNLMNDLRTGSISKMRLVGNNGMMVAKIDARGGGSFYAYMWMESLRCPLLRQIWGDLIDFSVEGTLSKRAACAYEVAKTAGLDDLTPPTAFRMDADGDIRAMLPNSLIESYQREWVAMQTGKSKDDLRNEIGAYASVQLIRGEPWAIEKEDWFRNLFGNPDNSDALNNVWQAMPPDRRAAFLRCAALDYLVGNLDRSFGDMAFSDDPRHPVMMYGGELTCVCPRKVGLAYSSGTYSGYADPLAPDSGGIPLLWSDPATMLATRGGDAEIDDFEQIGISVASRMKDDRGIELARTLFEYRLPILQIAGILSRIWLMMTHSRDIARDPYVAARYYASIVSGQPDPQLEEVANFVNNTMRKVLVGDFDFYDDMQSDKETDEDPAG
jgi:hypothetical protein